MKGLIDVADLSDHAVEYPMTWSCDSQEEHGGRC